MKRIAIFASGAGTNTQKIIDYFRKDHSFTAVKGINAVENGSQNALVALIVSDKPHAGVLNIAAKENIPVLLIEKQRFFEEDGYLKELAESQIDLIVLAGFLWKIPGALIQAYPYRIINIHPALLPGYGGKGMYGNKVHEAVIAKGEKLTGITIHFVDGHYDNGDIIFQAQCPVLPGDTVDSLAARVHQLEYEHYPRVIKGMVEQLGKQA